MGYLNDFNLRVMKARGKSAEKIIDEIEKRSKYTFHQKGNTWASLMDAVWEKMRKDVAAVAKRHPTAIIEVERIGEDRDDNEKVRFRGEVNESVTMEKTYPPFRTILTAMEKAALVSEPVMYIATVVEVDEHGEVFTAIYHGMNYHNVADEIAQHLDVEMSERGVELEYDLHEIIEEVAGGNEYSGPLRIKAKDRDCTFYVATKVIVVKYPKD